MAAVAMERGGGSGVGMEMPTDPKPRVDSASSMDSWTTYNFDWLFDPDRFDHLPIEEQLKLYKQRDLAQVHFFKTACKIFGAPRSRKRVIVAPPMNTEWQENTRATSKQYKRKDDDIGDGGDGELRTIAQLKPQIPPPTMPTKEQLEEWKGWDKESQYKSWVKERKSFRSNLENMGLNEEWLSKKPNKTALEHRVLRRMMEEKYPRVPTPPPKVDTPLEAILPEESPVVRRPSPLAIRIIEKFLQRKKMRLLDLFAAVDKHKKWKITRDEFRKAIQGAKIPISEVLLEDLVLALDTDLNNQLDYRELAKGMGLWKKEKIDNKRKLVTSGSLSHSPTKYSQVSGFETPAMPEEDEDNTEADDNESGGGRGSQFKSRSRSSPGLSSTTLHDTKTDPTPCPSRVKSALSTISSGSSYLEPPQPDLRPEQMLLSSEEAMLDLRKHNKVALARLTADKSGRSPSPKSSSKGSRASVKHAGAPSQPPGMIRTGDAAVDRHMMPSTLSGQTGELVDKFRQEKLREYDEIRRLCELNEVPFTEEMLKKVFLFPGDRPPHQIKHHIRQPAVSLISEKFANPPKKGSRHADKNNRAPVKPVKGQTQRSQKGQGQTGRSSRKGQSPGASVGARNNMLEPIKRDAAGRSMDGGSHSMDGGGRSMGGGGRSMGGGGGGGGVSDSDGEGGMGGGLQDSRNAYPTRSSLRPQAEKMHLSTGKAIVRTKVGCWMTFEEYDRLTRHLATRYSHGKSDSNAFWPGQLLDKMRIYLDNEPKTNSVFAKVQRETRSNPGYDNNLNTWNISDQGTVQYGTIAK